MYLLLWLVWTLRMCSLLILTTLLLLVYLSYVRTWGAQGIRSGSAPVVDAALVTDNRFEEFDLCIPVVGHCLVPGCSNRSPTW